MNERAEQAALECTRRATGGNTQSGKHIDPVSKLIVEDMMGLGYDPSQLYSSGREVILPGWFRPSKKWDIAAYENGVLIGAIELKSISSSFGNNANNRAEESIGSATDVEFATRNHLLEPTTLKPNFGFVLLVNENEESSAHRERRLSDTPIYGVDPRFEHTSYIDRFTILGERLLEERVYQAVWMAAINLDADTAREPSPLMTYEKFLANVKSWLDIARA